MNSEKQKLNTVIVILMDMLAISLSFFIANYIRFGDFFESGIEIENGSSILVIALVYIGIYFLRSSGLRFFRRGAWQELISVLRGNIYLIAVIIVLLFLVKKSADFSRLILLYFFIGNLLLMFLFRMFYKIYLNSIYKYSNHSKRLVILTVKECVQEVLDNLEDESMWDYIIQSLVLWDAGDEELGEKIRGIEITANKNNLFEYAKQAVMDEVFINMPYNGGIDLYPIIESLEDMGAIIDVNIQVLDKRLADHNKQLQIMGDYYVTSFYKKAIGLRMEVVKRFIDIAGAIVGLVFTGISVIFVAPFLLLESPGPLFFSQMRIGKNGRRFQIYKFRSMYKDAEDRKQELLAQNEMNGLMFKMKDDPRITRVGKFIRKTSIDELPQFWNVLKGDMSLIGTRPPTVDEFEKYKSQYKRRLSLRPGITGLWQVSGRSNIQDFEDVLALDLKYIDTWSLGLDIKILFQTVYVVLFRRGAT